MFDIIDNPYQQQNNYKRVLCVCSAGLLRSATTAVVLSKAPYNFNTRACGTDQEMALVPINARLVQWADEVVVMTPTHMAYVNEMFSPTIPVTCLDVPDRFAYRDPKLVKLIRKQYNVLGHFKPQSKKV